MPGVSLHRTTRAQEGHRLFPSCTISSFSTSFPLYSNEQFVDFVARNSGTVSFNLSRVFNVTASTNVFLLVQAIFTSGTMNASSSCGMNMTRIG